MARRRSKEERLAEAQGMVQNAMVTVEDLQEKMQSWFDNMPGNLQGSSKGGVVESVANDFQSICDALLNLDTDFGNVEFLRKK